jgi:hypothetical protein
MAARKAFDQRPGPLPDIQMDADSVTYAFQLVHPAHARLSIRCDAYGRVWASISDEAAAGPSPRTAE